METNKYLCSVTEGAEIFNIGRDKLYQMIKSNDDMPVIKVGPYTKINVPMFKEFLNKCTQEGREL